MHANRFSFVDQDMFTHYAAIDVGHNAVHLRRKHGLVGNQLATNNEEDNINEIEDTFLSHVSQNNRHGDGDNRDKDERNKNVDSDSSVSEAMTRVMLRIVSSTVITICRLYTACIMTLLILLKCIHCLQTPNRTSIYLFHSGRALESSEFLENTLLTITIMESVYKGYMCLCLASLNTSY